MFTGKIYTDRKFFTRPPVATVMTNFKSEERRKKKELKKMNWKRKSQ